MTNRFLTNDEIAQMAEAASTAYEMQADWSVAVRAAKEHATDELGVKPSKSAVLLAAKLGRQNWKRLI